ncbi:MAG: right-handed parallel beta-helix repeat-containing protein [Fidelibacterota bacterium]|nr:MAG: right-handed parallel beta-helix repeat-containing protein [Candidatus Neomarinimicrobiota bacterium]
MNVGIGRVDAEFIRPILIFPAAMILGRSTPEDGKMRLFLRRTITFILLSISLGANTLVAEEYFVSSPDQITTALAFAQPGDTLTMIDGIWANAEILFKGNGTAEQPILLRAQTPGRVVLVGTSFLQISGTYLVVDGLYFRDGYSEYAAVIEFRDWSGTRSQYCRLTNTAIVNYNDPEGSSNKWISLYGQHNRVDHCYMHGKNNEGTTLVVWLDGQPNYHLIDHNYFAYRPPLGINGGETIRVGTSSYSLSDSYTTVEHNYFERCNGETEIISSKSCENIYRYNTFYECEGTLTLRHGNRCTVEGNFFLGNSKSMTGGVRVIGEDHLVYNNYFQDLSGTGYRSALGIMNGVPNSPLNRYFQVKRAQVLFNTFINCSETFGIGLGADEEKTLPPDSCVIGNNLVLADTSRYIITYVDNPLNLTWAGNIMFGAPLGIDQPTGIIVTDPLIGVASDGLWRPDNSSPAVGAAVGNYPFIADDLDGQSRGSIKDIGADEISNDPVIRRPLTPEDVGPDWWPLPPEPPTIVQVSAGLDSLYNAVIQAEGGDIIELVTDGGVYENSSNIPVTVHLTIRAAEGFSNRPVFRQTNASTSTRILFEIKDGGSLTLQGLRLDGMAGTDTPAKYLLRTDDDPMTGSYVLKVDDCYLHDVVLGEDGNFFRAYAGTYADTIIFANCLFTNSGKEGVRLKDEADGSGLFNVGYFELTNCTFWNTRKEAISIYAGDDVPYTPGPTIRINHCTFDDCGYDSTVVIHAREADDTIIRNSIFTNNPTSDYAVILYGLTASITYCNTFNIGTVNVERKAVIGGGMVSVDPMYADRLGGDFTLASNSPVRGQADDGKALGDLRWSGEDLTIADGPRPMTPQSFVLKQNYPNPFNSYTWIEFLLDDPAMVSLVVYDLRGVWIETLLEGQLPAGGYTFPWQPRGISSGIYYGQLTINGRTAAVKMIYMK